MVKIMQKMKRKFGFSLTETMILITILAIAIAASTPIITRKIVNITDAGATLSGGAHGRYEIYTKEIITFGGDSYEKTTSSDSSSSSSGVLGGASGSVVVFRRLPDNEYISITAQAPKLIVSSGNKTSYKSTLYEQIDNAKVYRKPNGEIEYVEFKDTSNMSRKYPVGGNIIVENADVKYVKGCLDKNSIPKNFTKAGNDTCFGTKVTLPNGNNRIIEGNLTDKYKDKHPATHNDLWHLDADKKSNSEGEVTTIPWESVISGGKVVIDRPIPPTKNPTTGKDEYIGTFDPGQNAKNVVVHAVGGGGAGGGISNAGSAIAPNSATQKEIEEMRKTLAQRFRDAAKGKGITAFESKSVDQIVKVVYEQNLYKKSYDQLFNIDGNSSATDGYYIILNKHDGTITVRVDVRNGLIFPNELLDYTKVLGSTTQQALIYDMPVWGGFDTIYNREFYAAAVGKGCAGGKGADYTWIENKDYDCKRAIYCPNGPTSDYEYGSITCGGDCAQANKQGICIKYNPTYTVKPNRNCTYSKCDGTHYTRYTTVLNKSGGCGGAPACPANPGEFLKADYSHTYYGGAGGSAPDKAVACIRVKEPVDVVTNCYGNCPGLSGANKVFTTGATSGNADGLMSGQMGRSCFPRAGNKGAMSIGGGGGTPCPQTQIKLEGDVAHAYNELNKLVNDIGKGVGMSSSMDSNGVVSVTVSSGNSDSVTSAYDGFAQGFQSVASLVRPTTTNQIGVSWLCTAMPSRSCGIAGSPGQANSNCDSPDMLGIGSSEGRYNHIYAWTMPYSINRLTYGEAGEAGEYKSTKISKITAALKIKLGQGGVWANEDWKSGKKGPDGTDTVVSMGNKTVLVAKGGKGGKQSQYTNRYDLCYAKAGECKLGSNTINCCESEKGTRSTKDILVTAGKMSAFENIKSLVGNSLIIGTGLGRGGDGAGTRAGVEENYDKRYFLNASGYGLTDPEVTSVFKPPLLEAQFATGSANANDYKNTPLKPSEMNFKGGDGAVIITW